MLTHFPISDLDSGLLNSWEVRSVITERYREYGFTAENIPSCMRMYGSEAMLYALAVLSDGYVERNKIRAEKGDIFLYKTVKDPAKFLSATLKEIALPSDYREPDRYVVMDEWFDVHGFVPVAENGSYGHHQPRVSLWRAPDDYDATEMLLESVLAPVAIRKAA